MSQYIRTAVDAWAVVAKAEAEDALCMETWLANLKERWAGFTKLRGITEQQQEQLMGEWCQRYFGPQDGEMGRYLLACYIMGSVGGMGGMMPKEHKGGWGMIEEKELQTIALLLLEVVAADLERKEVKNDEEYRDAG